MYLSPSTGCEGIPNASAGSEPGLFTHGLASLRCVGVSAARRGNFLTPEIRRLPGSHLQETPAAIPKSVRAGTSNQTAHKCLFYKQLHAQQTKSHTWLAIVAHDLLIERSIGDLYMSRQSQALTTRVP